MCGLSWAKRVEAQKPQEGPGPGGELWLEITTEKMWARCGKMGEACRTSLLKFLSVSHWLCMGRQTFVVFHHPVNCLPSPWSFRPLLFSSYSGWHVILNCPSVFDPLTSLWGSCMYEITFVFLLLICYVSLINRVVRRMKKDRGKKFSSLAHYT